MKPASLAHTFYSALGDRRARWLGSALALLAILLICRVLYQERARLSEIEPDGAFLIAATLSVFAVVLGNMFGSVASWLLLRREAAAFTLPFLVTVNGLAQMAKYLPGNVVHLVGRFYTIKLQTDAKVAFAFSIYELLLLSLCGCALGLLYVHYVQPGIWPFAAVAVLSLLLLAASVVVLFRLGLLKASLMDLSMVALLYLVSFLCFGLAFSALFQLVFDMPGANVLLCAVLFALAFVVGYVTPGAPGGLGVREFVFMILAQPLIDSTLALGVIVMFRFFSVAGDLLFSLGALVVRKAFAVKLVP